MIGAIFGDIVGSVYEFDNHRSKEFPLFREDSEFTDDSVMTVAVAEALLSHKREDGTEAFKEKLMDSMHKWGHAYPDAGYGSRFFWWLARRERRPYNSFGNGSAMRVSPVAWYAESLKEAMTLARASAEVTHNHPEGIKGAEVTAGAIFLARAGATMEQIRGFAECFYDLDFTIDGIRPTYRFNETCQDTVPQAMEAFLESTSFEDCIRTGVSVGGDTDTLCAIAGAIAEAYYGLTPEERAAALDRLDPPLREVTLAFEAACLPSP